MKQKKLLVTAVTIAMLFGITVTANAGEVYFAAKDVDSNTYTAICSATKQAAGDVGEVKITVILKADGSSSNYKRVYCKATGSGTEKLVYKGDWYSLSVPSSYQAAGSRITLYAKGHDPSLDCKISGYWNVH